jgi:hypothetical protein
MSDDPVLEKLLEWEAKYRELEMRLDELERLLDRHRQLSRAIEAGVPPPPAPLPCWSCQRPEAVDVRVAWLVLRYRHRAAVQSVGPADVLLPHSDYRNGAGGRGAARDQVRSRPEASRRVGRVMTR